MDSLQSKLLRELKKFESLPFLFIGSGISRRYINLDDWESLLRKFAFKATNDNYAFEIYLEDIKDLEIKVDKLPKVAELIEKDFNRNWFRNPEYSSNREKFIEMVKKGISPFKIELAEYFKEKSKNIPKSSLIKEVELLKKVGERSIGGIITTNYDTWLESIFENYYKYIGQEELIFSKIQETAEIYKIHGCCTKPESIIINDNDYFGFNERNAYLAAKLMTIFLEHPIIFMGYSIRDKDIEEILKSIIRCLSDDKLEKLRDRLIFIERNSSDNGDEFSTYSKSFSEEKSIQMTKIKVKDFGKIYEVLLKNKAKYNPKILRKLKEHIYNLVLTNDPKEKIRVVGLEEGENIEDIEVVIGVGLLNEFGKKGYASIKAEEVFLDIVYDDRNFNHKLIVEETLPELLKHHNNSIPIYKYICDYNEALPYRILKAKKEKFVDLLNHTIIKSKKNYPLLETSIDSLREQYSDSDCLNLIPKLSEGEINLNELKKYLIDMLERHPNILKNGIKKSNSKTSFKRLIKIYDWLKYNSQ